MRIQTIPSKHEVISALSGKSGAPRTRFQIRQVLRSPSIGIESSAPFKECIGESFFVDQLRSPINNSMGLTDGWPPTAYKEFSVLVADFGEYLTAVSQRCVDDASGRYLLLEEVCDPALAKIAEVVARELGLRYIDAAGLHAMSLDWDELPKDKEVELSTRLHYSDPNAFSLMFFEWD